MFVFYLVHSFPSGIVLLFFYHTSTDYRFCLVSGEVHILENHLIFAKVTQDVGVTRGVLEEFGVLDHLKIVVFLIDSVERYFIGSGHISTGSVTHSNNKIIPDSTMARNHRRDFSLPHHIAHR